MVDPGRTQSSFAFSSCFSENPVSGSPPTFPIGPTKGVSWSKKLASSGYRKDVKKEQCVTFLYAQMLVAPLELISYLPGDEVLVGVDVAGVHCWFFKGLRQASIILLRAKQV